MRAAQKTKAIYQNFKARISISRQSITVARALLIKFAAHHIRVAPYADPKAQATAEDATAPT